MDLFPEVAWSDSIGRTLFRRLRYGLLAALFALSVSGLASGQAAAPALKAAFLYNFSKFTVWPADALGPGARMIMCATDDAVVGALVRTTAGRSVEGHELDIRRVSIDNPRLRDCHVLYVSDLDRARAVRLLDGLKGASVLTVSDLDQFVQVGGVAQFFVEGGQMRFAISVESARRARLQLSSRLLSLAKTT